MGDIGPWKEKSKKNQFWKLFPQKKVLRKNYFGKIFPRKSRPIPPLQLYRKIVSEVYMCQAKWAYKQKK